jgi:hypothetical protein
LAKYLKLFLSQKIRSAKPIAVAGIGFEQISIAQSPPYNPLRRYFEVEEDRGAQCPWYQYRQEGPVRFARHAATAATVGDAAARRQWSEPTADHKTR